MKRILTLLFALATISSCTVNMDNSLPRADESELPCNVNVFHNVFNDVFFNRVDELHGLMVLQNGKVIYEEYSTGFGPDFKHVLWSASKTFTATAIGFARQDGLLDVNDKVVSFFGDDILPEERSEWLDNLTIHHLLCMSACLKETLDGRMRNGEDFDWVKDALSKGFNFEPGSRFFYNSVDSHILSAIVTKVTGKTDNLKSYIQTYYNENPDFVYLLLVGEHMNLPAYPLEISARSDNYYGMLEGNDYYEEVCVGRLPVNSVEDAKNQVNKIIHYERDINESAKWLSRASGIAADEGTGHYAEIDYHHIDYNTL